MKSVLILGGGYAGLSAAILLARRGEYRVQLLDPEPEYLSLIHIHKSIQLEMAKLRVSYQKIANKFTFEYARHGVSFDFERLRHWDRQGRLSTADGREFDFDALIVAIGASGRSPGTATSAGLRGLRFWEYADVRRDGLGGVAAALRAGSGGTLTVVGGGATGIQTLFELADFVRDNRLAWRLRLIDAHDRVLSAFPANFHDYVTRRMRERGIEYRPGLRFDAQRDGVLVARASETGEFVELPSAITLALAGVVPGPPALRADRYGRILDGETPLTRSFGAGDCTHFLGSGLNNLSAQAAVRKGRRVAENVTALLRGGRPQPYTYVELGSFVSLGSGDGVGWLLVPFSTLTGVAAFAAKEAIEVQFRLFLEGLDTYFDVF